MAWLASDNPPHRLCGACGIRRTHEGHMHCYDCDEGVGACSAAPLSLRAAGRRAAEGDLAAGFGVARALLPSILTRDDDYARGYAEVVRLALWLDKEAA